MTSKGDFIGGVWYGPQGETLTSVNPARSGEVVFQTAWDAERVHVACEAAATAAPGWAALSRSERVRALEAFKQALEERLPELADAIRLEIGKTGSEAGGEARSLVSRFGIVARQIDRDMGEGPVAGEADAVLRYHPHGVVGVIGPFNYPLHLCHAHVVPALMMGNAVVIKPSEIAPLAGQRYAEAAEAAGLPDGVVNVVQGRGASGAALVANRHVRGLCFTGSYAVGRRILEASVERPELLVALEMGGKNVAVVLDDADLRQAAHEIVVGGYLSAGQRCTATDRVLVHARVVEPLMELLVPLVRSLRFGDPEDPSVFAGPLATAASVERVTLVLERARAAGAEALVEGGTREGGFYCLPSLHRLPAGVHHVEGYTDEELFGPDLCVEVVDDDAEAVKVLNGQPYGLANSVFSASRERFEEIFRGSHAGILNFNRTTNQASARLPFGGVGRSGNYRPAGAHASRNVVYPVASREQQLGEVSAHPMLVGVLPPVDLERLEARHRSEEREEAEHTLFVAPRPLRRVRPMGGALPRSEAWLARLYAESRVPKEKKPVVFDHLRSAGPWMVSVDETPLSVLDGMSQTATLSGGFADDAVVRALIEGEFGDTLLGATDTTAHPEHPAIEAFAEQLRSRMPGLNHVSFTNSGAEANEKAMALARLHSPSATAHRVMAFQGGFHGRTLLALHATWNPAKRGPFELAGYEVGFAPFPVAPMAHEALSVKASPDFLAQIARGELDMLISEWEGRDPLVNEELRALRAVDTSLRTGEYFAVIVEPMQCEGGDRYATARFFQALRLVTRRHDVSLIFDEVQTGFGLGGPFLWHSRYDLVDADGRPDTPDAVTFAKRAQVGVCVSRFPDPEPTATHTASLVRGRLHAMSTDEARAREVESWVKPRLQSMAQRYPELVSGPRACGYAFAFDLPSPEHLKAYLGQRFWRGAVVFGAGTHTVRYRLATSWEETHVERLFETVRRTLSWLDAHPGQQPPAWEDNGGGVDDEELPTDSPTIRVRGVEEGEDVDKLLDRIIALEARVYEPARRDSREHLAKGFSDAHGVVTLVEQELDDGTWDLVGFCLASPLERVLDVRGPDKDIMQGRNNTLYSLSLTVDPSTRGMGLGRILKLRQIEQARALRKEDGRPRYRYLTGRCRLGTTEAMMHINQSYGAVIVEVYPNAYGEVGAQALYYRIPLRGVVPDPSGMPESAAPERDVSDGISRPLGHPPSTLVWSLESGLLAGPAVNKLTVMNYITPAGVRALEWVTALTPYHPHIYLTSCRDELVDKSLRLLRYHRKKASVAIAFEGGYLGHTTAAARSLSDPRCHRQGPPHFDWPRVPHPATAGVEVSIAAIREAITAAGGIEQILGLFIEPVQERRGHVVPDAFWTQLAGLRRELGLPVVCFETATACYRSGRGPFYTSSFFVPDLLAWWAGGQQGFIHCTSRFYVSKPLTMVSTWDGDELCLVRVHHQLRAARGIDMTQGTSALDAVVQELDEDFKVRGRGLYRVIEAGPEADRLVASLSNIGVTARAYPGGYVALVPHLDCAMESVRLLHQAFSQL